MAASIEILSLLLAEIVAVPVLLHAHSSSGIILAYTFGMACGGLGSRLSASGENRRANDASTAARTQDETGSRRLVQLLVSIMSSSPRSWREAGASSGRLTFAKAPPCMLFIG